MRETMLEDYWMDTKPLAWHLWGRPCIMMPTNRDGVRYYLCKRDGGYLADSSYLTEGEQANLRRMLEAKPVKVAVQLRKSGDVVLGEDLHFSGKRGTKRVQYDPSLGEAYWLEYPIFVAKDADGWCVLEKITGVRLKESERWSKEQKKAHDEAMNQCFEEHLRDIERR